jgi:hypothetical protein
MRWQAPHANLGSQVNIKDLKIGNKALAAVGLNNRDIE